MSDKGTGHHKSKIIPFSRSQALYSSLSISLLINILIFLGLLFGGSRRMEIDVHWYEYVPFFFLHLFSNIILFYLLFRFNFYAIRKKSLTRRRVLYIFLVTILICIVLSPVLSEIQYILMHVDKDAGFIRFATFNLTKDLVVGVIVIILTHMMNLYVKRERTVVANQKLMQENIRVKYESLKNQLDPHFLFNSLNTLNGLVGVDDDKAHEYIDNLSSVFRYTLHSKTTCSLSEEMEFVEAYFSLMRIRYGESLTLQTDIDPSYERYRVIPVSIQLLVENAVKHNIISNSDPLEIVITTGPDCSVRVSNRINLKMNVPEGGIGLANLAERYSMIFGKPIVINESDGEFSVTLPLIKNIDI